MSGATRATVREGRADAGSMSGFECQRLPNICWDWVGLWDWVGVGQASVLQAVHRSVRWIRIA